MLFRSPDYAEAVVSVPENGMKEIKKISDEIDGINIIEKNGSMIIKSYGIPAHGSTPEKGKNAITHLMLFLGKIGFTGDFKEFVDFFNKYIGIELNGQSLGIYSEDEISGKLIVNLGTIFGDENEINIEINMRYPVTKKFDDFIGTFKEKISIGKLEEVYLRHKESLYVSPDTKFIKKLQKVYEEKFGEKEIGRASCRERV